MDIKDIPLPSDMNAASLAMKDGLEWQTLTLYEQITYMRRVDTMQRINLARSAKCPAERLAIMDGRDWNKMKGCQRNGYLYKASRMDNDVE
jgi:hypothetical protein